MGKKALHYIALGDSLTVGYGAAPGFGFVPIYAKLTEMSLQSEVDIFNEGTTGASSEEILSQIKQESSVRDHIVAADLITITAGGNDLIEAGKHFFMDRNTQVLTSALNHFQANYSEIVAQVKELKKGRKSRHLVRLINLYNPLVGINEAEIWIKRFNKPLVQFRDRNIQVVNIYDAFAGHEERLLFEDGIHPNAAGYKVIATRVQQTGYAPLV